MAKEKGKKVSGEMNAEELENVAGGWCFTGGKSAPAEVKSIKKVKHKSGGFEIIIEYNDGSYTKSEFYPDGTNRLLTSADMHLD